MTVVIASGGAGSTRLQEVVLTRWCTPAAGALAFVREPATGRCWPAGLPAGGPPPDEYAEELAGGAVSIRRWDGDIGTVVDVCVSPFDDVEVRRLTVLNRGPAPLKLQVGTSAELVLQAVSDARAGAALHVEALPAPGGMLVTRPAPADEDAPWLLQLLLRAEVEDGDAAQRLPAAEALGLYRELALRPGESGRLLAVTGAARSREEAEELALRYARPPAAEAAFGAALERARNLLADLRIPHGWAARIPDLTGRLLAGPQPAAFPVVGLAGLKAAGLTGGIPLLLASGGAEPVSASLALASYWRRQGLAVDLLVLASSPAEAEVLRERARARAAHRLGRTLVAAPGELADDLLALAGAAASVVFDAELAEVVSGA